MTNIYISNTLRIITEIRNNIKIRKCDDEMRKN